jgi:hypothetical protein
LSFLTLVIRGALLMLWHLLPGDAHGLLAARTRARSPSGLRRSSLLLHRLCCILLLVRGTSHETVSTSFSDRWPAQKAGSFCSDGQEMGAEVACTCDPRQARVTATSTDTLTVKSLQGPQKHIMSSHISH